MQASRISVTARMNHSLLAALIACNPDCRRAISARPVVPAAAEVLGHDRTCPGELVIEPAVRATSAITASRSSAPHASIIPSASRLWSRTPRRPAR